MNKYLYILLLTMGFICKSYTQSIDVIYLDEFKVYITLTKSYPDTFDVKLSESKRLIYFINDSLGKGKVKLFGKDSVLLIEGAYENSLGELREYSSIHDVMTNEIYLDILSFYQPIPIGAWNYYNEEGKLVETKNHNWIPVTKRTDNP